MEETILAVQHLSHRYTKNWAIRDINFEIGATGIVGLLGSNGAGKSTTMNIMCGALRPTEGEVLIDGIDMWKDPMAAKRKIGFLPQNPPLHLDLTVDEYLMHCAYMRMMEPREIPAALAVVKEKCGVAHYSKRVLRNLSGGYRQRVGIAQAIIHMPKLVVLDEPTNGLDPIQIYEVRSLIKEIAKERAVIFSSHILSEVQATCREIKMIENGRMVFADTMDAFNNYIEPDSLLVTLQSPPPDEELYAIPGVTKVELIHGRTYRLRYKSAEEISPLIVKTSVMKGWELAEINLEKSSLDEVFAQLSRQTSQTKKA